MLIEYVRPLMRVRIICTSSKMRAKVAHRLRSEAKQLQEFFIQLVRWGGAQEKWGSRPSFRGRHQQSGFPCPTAFSPGNWK